MSKESTNQSRKTVEAYNAEANIYEEKWEKYLKHTHTQLLNVLETEPGHRILDISAGTGLFAKYLIENGYSFSELVLNDVSRGMLDVARGRFESQENIVFEENYAEDLSFESSTFDTVISLNAFHNYEAQQKVLTEIYRVLKPGGHLYILDWNKKGVFNICNIFIKLFAKQQIRTLSLEEIVKNLRETPFKLVETKEWRYGFWRFYLVKAKK